MPYFYDLEWFDGGEPFGVVRGYTERGNPEYDGVATIISRPGGLHEPFAWMTKEGSVADFSVQGARFLFQEGLRVAWTFEVKKFEIYRRMFRGVGKLKILRSFQKEYNGVVIPFHYGEIIPRK